MFLDSRKTHDRRTKAIISCDESIKSDYFHFPKQSLGGRERGRTRKVQETQGF